MEKDIREEIAKEFDVWYQSMSPFPSHLSNEEMQTVLRLSSKNAFTSGVLKGMERVTALAMQGLPSTPK
jgi:hypothetical protein